MKKILLKNRPVVCDSDGCVLSYSQMVECCNNKEDVFVVVINDDSRDLVKVPCNNALARDILMFVLGLEYCGLKVWRKDLYI